MNLFWIILLTCTSTIIGTSFCFYLLRHVDEVEPAQWLLEQVICPIIRIVVLLFIASLIYPAISPETSTLDYWRVLWEQQHFNQAINILFFGSLLLAFVPVVPTLYLPCHCKAACQSHWCLTGNMALPCLTILSLFLTLPLLRKSSSIYLSFIL